MNEHEVMFVNAAKKKYRFPSNKGLVMVEDLFDVSQEQLNKIYQSLVEELKVTERDSLMAVASTQETTLKEKIEIVKFVFTEKAKAAAERNEAVAKAMRKQTILKIIDEKENQALKDLSVDDLKKMLED